MGVERKFAHMARGDRSPAVRLALASALQRLPLGQRWAVAEGLAGHAEDAADANLPLMIWYGVEPLVSLDRERFVGLILNAKIPLIRENVARRVASLAN